MITSVAEARLKRLKSPHALTKGEGLRIALLEKRCQKRLARKNVTDNDRRYVQSMTDKIRSIKHPPVSGRTKAKIRRLEAFLEK